MTYTAIYADPYDSNGVSEEGTAVTYTLRLQIGTDRPMEEDKVKQILRQYLSERFHITDIKEEKIRIE